MRGPSDTALGRVSTTLVFDTLRDVENASSISKDTANQSSFQLMKSYLESATYFLRFLFS